MDTYTCGEPDIIYETERTEVLGMTESDRIWEKLESKKISVRRMKQMDGAMHYFGSHIDKEQFSKALPIIEAEAKKTILQDFLPVLEALEKEGGLIEGLGAIKVLVQKIKGYRELLRPESPKED